MTPIVHITDKEQALQRENERLTDQVKRQSATIHVQAVAIQAMKADAERYQWMVNQIATDGPEFDRALSRLDLTVDPELSPSVEQWNAAIDQAMKESKS